MPKPKTSVLARTGGYFASVKNNGITQAEANISTTLNSYSYDEMRNHPTLSAGLAQIKFPILSVDWNISGKNKERAKEIEKNIRRLWTKLSNDMLMAFDYGFSPFQRVFGVENGKVIISQMRPLKPHYTKILVDKYDTFSGLRFDYENVRMDLTTEESAVFTYNCEYSNMYGISRLRSARYPYNVSKFIIEMCSMFYEAYGDPRYVAFAPDGKTRNPDNGEIVDNIAYVSDKVNALNNGGGKHITFPARKKEDPQFDIKPLESTRNGADYIDFLNYLDAHMLQALLVPSVAVMPSERGSFALMKELNSMFAFQFDAELAKIKDFIEKEMIDILAYYNWGKEEIGAYKFNYMPMTKKDIEGLRNISLAMVQGLQIKPNLEWLSEQSGIPFEMIEQAVTPQPVAEEKPVEEETEEEEVEEKKEMSRCSCGSVHMEKVKRELSPFEKKVDYNAVNMLFESYKDFGNKLMVEINNIRDKFMTDAKALVDAGDIDGIDALALEYKNKYRNLFTKNSLDTFEKSVDQVSKELGEKAIGIGKEQIKVERLKALNVADKQLMDMEFATKNIVASAIANKIDWNTTAKQLMEAFDVEKERVRTGVEVTIQEFVDDGRRYGFDETGTELVVWSAVLDDVTCPVCEAFDNELVVRTDSEEYAKYSPGNMHFNCRCIWVGIGEKEENPPEVNVPNISVADENRYVRR